MMRVVIVLGIVVLAGCTRDSDINVRTNVMCPQAATATIAPAERLLEVPPLPADDPSAVIGILSETIVRDAEMYGNEKEKRETLVDHLVRLCGWSR